MTKKKNFSLRENCPDHNSTTFVTQCNPIVIKFISLYHHSEVTEEKLWNRRFFEDIINFKLSIKLFINLIVKIGEVNAIIKWRKEKSCFPIKDYGDVEIRRKFLNSRDCRRYVYVLYTLWCTLYQQWQWTNCQWISSHFMCLHSVLGPCVDFVLRTTVTRPKCVVDFCCAIICFFSLISTPIEYAAERVDCLPRNILAANIGEP